MELENNRIKENIEFVDNQNFINEIDCKKETIQLKHLAPYLPYGLNFKAKDKTYQLTTLHSLDKHIVWANKYWDDIKLIYYPETNNKGNYMGKGFKLNKIKPILRPLSDLTKEISYGLSTYSFTDLFEIGDCDGCIFEFEHGNIKTIKALENISKYNSYNDINYLPNAVVNMMYEYHFDVFGLIDNNLAIDINTLKL